MAALAQNSTTRRRVTVALRDERASGAGRACGRLVEDRLDTERDEDAIEPGTEIRCREDEMAAWPKDAVDLLEQPIGVAEMLDHLGAVDDRECAVGGSVVDDHELACNDR